MLDLSTDSNFCIKQNFHFCFLQFFKYFSNINSKESMITIFDCLTKSSLILQGRLRGKEGFFPRTYVKMHNVPVSFFSECIMHFDRLYHVVV